MIKKCQGENDIILSLTENYQYAKNTDMMTTGDKIRQKRKEAGLTREELATKLGLHWRTIHNYECGKSAPSIDMIPNLAAALEVDAAYFLS
jgi:DNA-binding XRE family transcriptional regulator